MTEQPATVDEYLAACPEDTRAILEQVRATILRVVPDAGQRISYRIPTFTVDGRNLVHVAAFAHHIGLYPVPDAEGDLAAEIERHRTGKGTLRFPLDQPVPHDLIARVVARLLEQRRGGS